MKVATRLAIAASACAILVPSGANATTTVAGVNITPANVYGGCTGLVFSVTLNRSVGLNRVVTIDMGMYRATRLGNPAAPLVGSGSSSLVRGDRSERFTLTVRRRPSRAQYRFFGVVTVKVYARAGGRLLGSVKTSSPGSVRKPCR